jgi:hypothetical protein
MASTDILAIRFPPTAVDDPDATVHRHPTAHRQPPPTGRDAEPPHALELRQPGVSLIKRLSVTDEWA